MNLEQTGRIIAKYRKEAGFTQKSLAEALFITDKAVSKWERGICTPDSSLLPRLSMLLNADVELLLLGEPNHVASSWSGYLVSENLDKIIYDKPILDYLISYFMLVGIRNIYIRTSKQEFVKRRCLDKFGLNIHFTKRVGINNWMIVNDERLIFGPNLTRQFQAFMSMKKTIIPVIDGTRLPIIFSHKLMPIEKYYREAIDKSLGRGMINLPFNDDAIHFVEIYQRNHTMISDLNEIAQSRGLLSVKSKPKVEIR